jgi:hypothetical protein
VHVLKYFSGIIFFLLIALQASGQRGTDVPGRKGSRVIDDTTRQIYGPKTAKYYYEEDVFFNRKIVHPIDTLIRNFHRWTYVQRYNYSYQDLGNQGTAIQPIFYQAPGVIGARSGFDVYSPYWDSETIRHYDTKSPYSNMDVILGGLGRSATKAVYSRNITPRWNFGFKYRGFFIDRQLPQRTGKGDRVTKSQYYDVNTTYFTKDSTYRIFASFKRMFHRVIEPGGVFFLDKGDSTFSNFFEKDVNIGLRSAESNDLRMHFHFSHQYQVGKALQLYHIFDRHRQRVLFHDFVRNEGTYYTYFNTVPHSDTVNNISNFRLVRNELGIKGNFLKLFYNGYYAIRHYNMEISDWREKSPGLKPSIPGLEILYTFPQAYPGKVGLGEEVYLGGRMELLLDSIGLVNGWAEANQNGNYRIEGRIASKWFEASLKQLDYRPGFAQQKYLGAFNYWNNTFQDIQSSQLNGYVHYKSSVFSISPGLTFTRLKNYVFFRSLNNPDTMKAAPFQSSGNQVFFAPEVRLSLTLFRHLTISGQAIYTSFIKNDDNAIRVPELFANGQIAYANIFYKGNMDMHAGADVHWSSAYFAQGYDPAIRQFYNQDSFKVNAFPVVDLFFNIKVLRGRIFFKYNNVVQAFKKTGYFATPYYPGLRNILDFGFDWSFYD